MFNFLASHWQFTLHVQYTVITLYIFPQCLWIYSYSFIYRLLTSELSSCCLPAVTGNFNKCSGKLHIFLKISPPQNSRRKCRQMGVYFQRGLWNKTYFIEVLSFLNLIENLLKDMNPLQHTKFYNWFQEFVGQHPPPPASPPTSKAHGF